MEKHSPQHDKQRIGIFTGGGIAPGLNSVISSAAKKVKDAGSEVIGLPDGWAGLLTKRDDIIGLSEMSRRELNELLYRPGTILGSSRTKITPDKYEAVRRTAAEYGLDGVIAIGGDDTLTQARDLQKNGILNLVGVPKTIDNDVVGTDRTFGFETAYHICAQRIRHMRHDAESMRRVAFVELMGRKAGWITLYAGKAGAADITLLREFPIPEERLLEEIDRIYRGKNGKSPAQRHVVIAVAEGYVHEGFEPQDESKIDTFGHVKLLGAARNLSKIVEEKLKLDTQVEVVGYHARNVEPVAADSIFASELGASAGLLVNHRNYGQMVALRNGVITSVPLSEVKGGRFVPEAYYDMETMSMRDVPFNIDSGIFEARGEILEALQEGEGEG